MAASSKELRLALSLSRHRQVALDRAREIWARADAGGLEVELYWSGGIDSTAALIALIQVGTGPPAAAAAGH